MAFKLSRRALLRGMAGGAACAIALPPLEAMFNENGDAYSDGSPLPARFMTFFFGNGILYDQWIPATQGTDYELTPQLAPLANVREYCAVMTGFHNEIGPKITHHEGMAGMFSAHPFVSPGGLYSSFGGPSIDQVVADHIGNDTYLRSIEIGCSKRVSTNEGPTMQFVSHRSADQPNPPLYNPVDVWQRLFGNFVPPQDPSGGLRISALDAVAEDARRLEARVGKNDQDRIDAHLTSYAELQDQIAALPPVCETPGTPTETNEDVGGIEPMPAVAKAMSDLLIFAFQCDVTRVASYMLTGGVGFAVYSHLGHTDEQHIMSHFPESFATELSETIVWNVEQFAYLLEQMKATPEGALNMLDNSVVVLGSDCGEGWSHSSQDHPIIVAGGGAGRLATGFHHRSQTQESLSHVLLAAMQAAAPDITEVGSAEGYSNTPETVLLE